MRLSYTDQGIEVRFTCWCGATQTERTGRTATSRVAETVLA